MASQIFHSQRHPLASLFSHILILLILVIFAYSLSSHHCHPPTSSLSPYPCYPCILVILVSLFSLFSLFSVLSSHSHPFFLSQSRIFRFSAFSQFHGFMSSCSVLSDSCPLGFSDSRILSVLSDSWIHVLLDSQILSVLLASRPSAFSHCCPLAAYSRIGRYYKEIVNV